MRISKRRTALGRWSDWAFLLSCSTCQFQLVCSAGWGRGKQFHELATNKRTAKTSEERPAFFNIEYLPLSTQGHKIGQLTNCSLSFGQEQALMSSTKKKKKNAGGNVCFVGPVDLRLVAKSTFTLFVLQKAVAKRGKEKRESPPIKYRLPFLTCSARLTFHIDFGAGVKHAPMCFPTGLDECGQRSDPKIFPDFPSLSIVDRQHCSRICIRERHRWLLTWMRRGNGWSFGGSPSRSPSRFSWLHLSLAACFSNWTEAWGKENVVC